MRGYYFFMEQSEFNPPARRSMTDEQISAHLGAATADEAGMLAAMDFLEEQTKLRDEDNRALEAWVSTMESSSDPRAAHALENFERNKQGLPPLEYVEPVEEVVEPTVVEVAEVNQSLTLEPSVGGAEEAADVFEELIQDAGSENQVLLSEPQPAPQVRGFRLVSAANWTIGFGVLAPAVGAAIASLAGLNFTTSILAGLVGVLVGLKVNALALVTARRTKRGLAVASRATFGVFGAIVPGLLLLLVGLTNLSAITFASSKYFNGTISGLPDFNERFFSLGDTSVSLGSVFAITVVLLISVAAIFGGGFARWLKIAIATLLLVGFVAFAALTIQMVNYGTLLGEFNLDKFLLVSPVFTLIVSVFTFALDGESIAAASWGASKKTLAWPILTFGVLLPILSYGHFAALLNGSDAQTGEELIMALIKGGDPVTSTLLVDLSLLAVFGLLFMGISKLIEALKTLGTNHIGYGSASLAALVFLGFVTVQALLASSPLDLSLSLTSTLIVPAAAWIGAVLAETVMRRGSFHDASLTRSYGFYGAFNWVAFIGYLLASTLGFSIAQPVFGMTWFGFLAGTLGFSLPIGLAALATMGFAVVFTLATSYPRILRQQRETKSVEDRRFDLVDVVVE